MLVGCGAKDDPFAIGERKTLGEATQAQQQEEQPGGPQGPSKDELIKFANWDDNRVKLTNWIAGYIVAHGLDHPVRMIDVDPEAYQDALTKNDVDIVLETDPAWAREEAESDDIIVLGTLSSENPDAKIVVHASMAERAPDVVEFLKSYALDGDVIRNQAARMTGGRTGLRENVVGFNFLKGFEEMWTPWVSAGAVENVKGAIEDGKSSLCRKWVTQFEPERTSYCEDDPSMVGTNV